MGRSSTKIGFFKNKNNAGNTTVSFTPTFAFNESVANANLTYTCNLSTNLPNTAIKYNIGGTIDDTEFLTGSVRSANITLDTNGNATISFTANTAISSDARTFRLEIINPNSNTIIANTNFHTLSGSLSNGIQIIPEGSNTYQQSEITVGSTVFTLYEFNANVGTVSGTTALQGYDIKSVIANGPVLDVLTVGAGGGAGTSGLFSGGGGGGGGGVSYYTNIVLPNTSYDFTLGIGGNAGASTGGGDSSVTANILARGGNQGTGISSANIGGNGGHGGGHSTFNGSGNGTGTVIVREGGGGGAGYGPQSNGERGFSKRVTPTPLDGPEGKTGVTTLYAGDGGDGFQANITNNLVTYGAGGGGAVGTYGAGGGSQEVAGIIGSATTASGIDEVDMLNSNFDLSSMNEVIRAGKFTPFDTALGNNDAFLTFSNSVTGNSYYLKANASNSQYNEMYSSPNFASGTASQSGFTGQVAGSNNGADLFVDLATGNNGSGFGGFGSGGNIIATINSVAGKGMDGVIYIRHPKNGDRQLVLN